MDAYLQCRLEAANAIIDAETHRVTALAKDEFSVICKEGQRGSRSGTQEEYRKGMHRPDPCCSARDPTKDMAGKPMDSHCMPRHRLCRRLPLL